jgi:hypothetical protein
MCFQGDIKQAVKSAKPARKAFKVACTDPVGKAIDCLLNSDAQSASFDRYHVDGDLLVYRAPVTDKIRVPADKVDALMEMIKAGSVVLIEPTLQALQDRADAANVVSLDSRRSGGSWDRPHAFAIKIRCIKQDVVAKRVRRPDGSTLYIGNSSVLGLIGRYVSFGRAHNNTNETEIQQRLSQLIPMVPFRVFEQAGLNLDSMRILERGPAESIERKREAGTDRKTGKPKYKLETVHFTGASLFQVDGSCFLFDIDRREVKEKVFNPFLAKLPVPVRTIAEAYDSLKPEEVKAAETAGQTVPRQGEWFFLPVDWDTAQMLDRCILEQNNLGETVRQIELRAGRNRPNYAQGISLYNGRPVRGTRVDNWQDVRARAESYVTGKVEHSGREHAPLILKGWYRAVPNTATESFTITGDID